MFERWIVRLGILLLMLMKGTSAVAADLSSLDKLKLKIQRHCPEDFFVDSINDSFIGDAPEIIEMKRIVQHLDVEFRIVSSVAHAVLALPYHPRRQNVSRDDVLEGWFDQYTSPKLILMLRTSTPMTLFHELRHAYHLGQKKLGIRAGKLDTLVMQLDVKSEHEFNGGKKLKEIVEIISEIIAYQDEIDLYQNCGYREQLKDSRSMQQDYVRQLKSKIKKFQARPSIESLIKSIEKMLPAIN